MSPLSSARPFIARRNARRGLGASVFKKSSTCLPALTLVFIQFVNVLELHPARFVFPKRGHEVLGDMKEGNGDPSLELFDENSTPNLHKLAREFVLLDNFYVNADVSADGHNWSTAAIAPDYVVKLWPNNYARRGKEYDFEEQDQASLPPAGYLWTNASLAGRSIRNFGYMVNEKRGAPLGADQITGVRDPVLAKVTNWKYQGFD